MSDRVNRDDEDPFLAALRPAAWSLSADDEGDGPDELAASSEGGHGSDDPPAEPAVETEPSPIPVREFVEPQRTELIDAAGADDPDAGPPTVAFPVAPAEPDTSGDLADDDSGQEPDAIEALFAAAAVEHDEPVGVLPHRRRDRPAAPSESTVHDASSADGESDVAGLSAAQKMLIWASVALVALLVLVAIFLLGYRAAGAEAPLTVAPTPTPTVTPEPTTVIEPVFGPLDPGEYGWHQLLGGECLDPFDGAWAEDFMVVSCAEEHAAQLVLRAPHAEADTEEFPGIELLAAPLAIECTSPRTIDPGAAAQYDDIRVEFSHPVTEEQWAEDARDFFCFATRASGEPLVGDLVPPDGATLAP